MEDKEVIIKMIQQADGKELEQIAAAVVEVIFSTGQVMQPLVHQT